MTHGAQLEAILLYRGEPVSKKELGSILNISKEDIEKAGEELTSALVGRGISLIDSGDAYTLATASEASKIIEKLEREEYSSELSRPALETLALIAYEGPLPKSKIDYVRGVNANFILRALTTRGLVEKMQDPETPRQTLYKATSELLGHLGISSARELPEYEEARKSLSERLLATQGNDKKQKEMEDLESDPDFEENE